eukprot:Skav220626  [mRNA]  locus=scaffold112:162327:168049:+ [translate_table: standard]
MRVLRATLAKCWQSATAIHYGKLTCLGERRACGSVEDGHCSEAVATFLVLVLSFKDWRVALVAGDERAVCYRLEEDQRDGTGGTLFRRAEVGAGFLTVFAVALFLGRIGEVAGEGITVRMDQPLKPERSAWAALHPIANEDRWDKTELGQKSMVITLGVIVTSVCALASMAVGESEEVHYKKAQSAEGRGFVSIFWNARFKGQQMKLLRKEAQPSSAAEAFVKVLREESCRNGVLRLRGTNLVEHELVFSEESFL